MDERPGPAVDQPLLVCMLPARNAEQELPGYLENVSGFCDAIVALDDGSTDSTYEILNAHPLVKVLLRNSQREDYRGWDDAANRNRLLEASQSLNPQWLFSLDADERLDERDATSLREFLETDALPGFAYGFRHVPMRDDGEHFLPKYLWYYRLFHAEPGQRFQDKKLHFIPVPTSIPRHRWIKTTLRIQHLGELTAEHRLMRFNKYLEADPHRLYQADYTQYLTAPASEDLRRWQPRPESIPVLLESGKYYDDLVDDERGIPTVSAIIVARNHEQTIGRTISSVVNQEFAEPLEVILVASERDRMVSEVRRDFPSVKVVEVSRSVCQGEAKNAGLAAAKGKFVIFLDAHAELMPGNIAARLQAHRKGYAMVAGVAANGTPTRAGWAAYFLDQVDNLPGLPNAELDGTPDHCSYARLPLLEVGGFPERVSNEEDRAVNRALVNRGYVAYRDSAVKLIHYPQGTIVPLFLRHFFQRGQGWGRLLVARHRHVGRMLNRVFVRDTFIEAVPIQLLRIETGVQDAGPELAGEYYRARVLVTLGALSTWLGMLSEVLRPSPGKLGILFARPVVNLLVLRTGTTDVVHLVQIDHVSREMAVRGVSLDLVVPHDNRTVTLADLICGRDSSSSEQWLVDIRESATTALNLDHLECLLFADEVLPSIEAADSKVPVRPVSRVARTLRTTITSLGIVARGRIRSTMPAWRTVRVVSRIHALTNT